MGNVDYPLLLRPHLAERIWGGNLLGRGIGEAWDLSVHANGPSTIANGPLQGRPLAEVVAQHPDAFGGPIELLAKRLDCRQVLSVQVHPLEGDPKTEAWVVLQADEGAGVYHGFARPVTRDEVTAAAGDGSLPRLLRFLRARPGESVFVPSGTVHAIGGGLFLFEIQQSSDTTYRLFDWGRGRDLHLEQGVACAHLDSQPALPAPRPQPDGCLRLVECDYFYVDRLDGSQPHPLDPGRKWTALLLVAGRATVGDVAIGPGETLLLPHAAGRPHLEPQGACTALLYGPPR